MNIEENVIINLDLNFKEEAELLGCFISDNRNLLFPCYEDSFAPDKEGHSVSNEEKDFISDRTIVKSKEHIIYWYPYNGETVYWYSLRSINELVSKIQQDYNDYVCIILEEGKDITKYEYLLSVEENYVNGENEDCRALLIKERNKGDFKRKVVPKIKEKFKSTL